MSTRQPDPDDGFVRITLRIPSALHQQLTEASAKKRSMNAEIIARLEDSFNKNAVGVSGYPIDAEQMMRVISDNTAINMLSAVAYAIKNSNNDKSPDEIINELRDNLTLFSDPKNRTYGQKKKDNSQ